MKKRILIIDDDHLLNIVNEKVLRGAGVVSELHIVNNGQEALSYLIDRIEKNYPMPDVIILDLHMPVMDGLAFLDEYNKLSFAGKSNIELVAFTASTNIKELKSLQSKGVVHVINKPYILRGLLDIIMRTKVNN